MSQDHVERAKQIDLNGRELFQAASGPMGAFRELMKSATEDGALEGKTKELMALAIAVATHCDGCISYHARGASKLGASREEVAETIGVAIEMGGGPAAVYGGEALAAFDQFQK